MGEEWLGSVLGSILLGSGPILPLLGLWLLRKGERDTSDSEQVSTCSDWLGRLASRNLRFACSRARPLGGRPSIGAETGLMYWKGSKKARLLGMFSKWWILEGLLFSR